MFNKKTCFVLFLSIATQISACHPDFFLQVTYNQQQSQRQQPNEEIIRYHVTKIRNLREELATCKDKEKSKLLENLGQRIQILQQTMNQMLTDYFPY